MFSRAFFTKFVYVFALFHSAFSVMYINSIEIKEFLEQVKLCSIYYLTHNRIKGLFEALLVEKE
jgi:hypothetical protein